MKGAAGPLWADDAPGFLRRRDYIIIIWKRGNRITGIAKKQWICRRLQVHCFFAAHPKEAAGGRPVRHTGNDWKQKSSRNQRRKDYIWQIIKIIRQTGRG